MSGPRRDFWSIEVGRTMADGWQKVSSHGLARDGFNIAISMVGGAPRFTVYRGASTERAPYDSLSLLTYHPATIYAGPFNSLAEAKASVPEAVAA